MPVTAASQVITFDGTNIGWLQSFVKEDTLFLAQLFVDRPLRGQGIGTEPRGWICFHYPERPRSIGWWSRP
jgi:hypothetical protein